MQISRRRHGVGEGVAGVLQKLLVVEEEERLVLAVIDFGNADGAAQRAAEIVAAVSRPDQTNAAGVVRKRIAGVQVFVDEVIEPVP